MLPPQSQIDDGEYVHGCFDEVEITHDLAP